MILSDLSIRRPVFALVVSLLLLIFGLVAFSRLPVREMPDVQSPSVSIVTTYEGAAPEIVENQVSKPLEDQLSGISGIRTIYSTSRKGRSSITIEFQQGWNMLEALSDIRDAVARARNQLPDEIDEPVVTRDNGEGEVAIWLNFASQQLDRVALTDYANRHLLKSLSLVNGVSSVNLAGDLQRVMYVRLDPSRMSGLAIAVNDVLDALARENVELPGGEIRNDSMVFPVQLQRPYQDAASFRRLPVRTLSGGQTIYLGDVADVEVGAKNELSAYQRNGQVSIGIGIIPQSTANPLEMAEGVTREVARLQRFLPAGAELVVDYNSTLFIRQAIDEVYLTLAIAALLVVGVLYLFIGQWRATLIPAVTVPVSLIAACIGAWYFGFSVNLITLLALILAIGLVVDDAIVVVENIHHHLALGRPPLLAAWHGTREVGFAVLATTVVLVMVFLPIAFMQGMIGRLFTEFALFLALAVGFSALVALTLSPAMAARLLRPQDRRNRLTGQLELGMVWLNEAYRRALRPLLRRAWLAPCAMLLVMLAIGVLYWLIPRNLAPVEDRGVIYVMVKGAEGTSIERMKRNMQQVESRLLPLVGQGVIGAISFSTPAFGRGSDQTGMVTIQLTDWAQREETAQQLLKRLPSLLQGIPDISLRPFQPGFRGRSQAPVQFVLQGGDYAELNRWALALKQAVTEAAIVENPDLDYSEQTPELRVRVDVERAAKLGVSQQDIGQALQTLLGGSSKTSFTEQGEEYDVYVRADQQRFINGNDLSHLYLRSAQGDMVSLASLAQFELIASPQRLGHYQRQKSITLAAYLPVGQTQGTALAWMDEWARQHLPAGMTVDYAGESKDFRDSQGDVLAVFALAVLVAFLVMAAQFESFLNPLVVMFTVPLGILGGLLGLWLLGLSLDLYGQIGMLLLIGMVTKNGILIVEFANQLRSRGAEFEAAIIEAAVRRLRPILMTSATAIIAAIPLMLSRGAGYESRVAVGTVVFFGMLLATLVTLFMVPACYRLLARHTRSPESESQRLTQALADERQSTQTRG